MQRPPAVAGRFYPERKADLEHVLGQVMPAQEKPTSAIAVMSPHAGYVYSGMVAGKTFSRVAIPETAVILGPNHHGRGHPAAVYARGSWLTPLGDVPVDEELAARILREAPLTSEDSLAHRYEHSLEVQVPFLQRAAPHLSIVPICLGRMTLDQLLELGDDLARALAQSEPRPLLVASTDMSHYEPGSVARAKDHQALDRVLALDPQGLYRVVGEKHISMCGMLPVVVTLQAAKALGASLATLVEYRNSGDVTGDQSAVVGYAGVIVT